MDLNKSIRYLKGVGPSREILFNKLGIFTLKDLLYYFPRTYEDRSQIKKIIELVDGEKASIVGRIIRPIREVPTRTKIKIYKTEIQDESGVMTLTWFNNKYVKNSLKVGGTYKFFGQVTRTVGMIDMKSPIFEDMSKSQNIGEIIGIYPSTAELSQNVIRNAIKNLFENLEEIIEFLPKTLMISNKLSDINFVLKNIHFPESEENLQKARRRLVFEELLLFEVALLSLKDYTKNKQTGIKFNEYNINEFTDLLPFDLTNAQKRVYREIEQDMQSDKVMNRLVQGDVGSGKTVVAAMAILKAIKSGYQAVLMAPTSILATQHYNTFKEFFKDFNINIELIIGSTPAKKKNNIKDFLRVGSIDLVIGTHALIEDDVEFKNLGLVITDEQHRFGVRQRERLSNKGNNPDVLVMTATPIPRTLAFILYGDLDISIIDELPPNRQEIETFVVNDSMEERINNFIRKQILEGRQTYVVCPLVEENEELDLKSVEQILEKYKEIFREFNVEYIHGKSRPKEKDEIMERFANHEIDILISTTVIEVGVNVPNANLMIIENSERFGLAQLHQLRGRVGRGQYKSYCILKCAGKGKTIAERMGIMAKTNDGFKIAEKDLELRGPGEFFGLRQHGLPEFKVANLYSDMKVLEETQKIAKEIVENPREYEGLINIAKERYLIDNTL